jgi:hypothetical protein
MIGQHVYVTLLPFFFISTIIWTRKKKKQRGKMFNVNPFFFGFYFLITIILFFVNCKLHYMPMHKCKV